MGDSENNLDWIPPLIKNSPSFCDPEFEKYFFYLLENNNEFNEFFRYLWKKLETLRNNILCLNYIINILNNGWVKEKLLSIVNTLMNELNTDEDKMIFGVENLKNSLWEIIRLRNAEQCMEALKSVWISIERHDWKNTSYDIIFHGLIIYVSSDMDIINGREFSFEWNVTLSEQYDLLQKFIDILQKVELPKQFSQEEVVQMRLDLCRSNMENN